MELLGDIFLVPDRHNITRQTIAQSSTWIVGAEPHGRLVDMTSGVRVAYLYWETTFVTLFCVAQTQLISLLSRISGLSSANSYLVTPATSRANNPCKGYRVVCPSVSEPG
jgi:hypothetical protein